MVATKAMLLASVILTVGAPREKEPGMSDEQKIRRTLEEFRAAWNASNPEALVRCYAEPHMDLNAPQAVQTRGETRAALEQFFALFQSSLEVTSDEVIVAGEWALQRGEFVQTLTDRTGGETRTLRRRYVEVLRRQPAGDWLVLWAMDAPLRCEEAR